MSTPSPEPPSLISRIRGAWWGLFIGDALALPYDGYVNLAKMREDYPAPHDYLAPKDKHPHSDLHRAPAKTHPTATDYIHHRRADWDNPGVHFHHGMNAGDNSFDAELALTLARHRAKQTEFSSENWRRLVKDKLLSPGGFRDFFIPKEYRKLIHRPQADDSPDAIQPVDIGPIVTAAPILIAYAADPDGRHRELEKLFSPLESDPALIAAAELYGDILRWIFAGNSPDDACYKKLGHHHHPYMIFPYHRWIAHKSDEEVATQELAQNSSASNALPLTIFLTLKYAGDFEAAIQANARLGGDACRRGALVGMLVGAHVGCEGIPAHFARDLTEFEAIEDAADTIWAEFKRHIPRKN